MSHKPVEHRDPEELIKGSRRHHPTQMGPYVLCYEASVDMQSLLQGKEKNLLHTYGVVVDAVEQLNEEFPGLELGYSIEDDTKEFTRRQ
jgi:hypothetical protein